MPTLRLVCISDTHGHHGHVALPAGDVLVHAGDFSRRGRLDEVTEFARWFVDQPHPHKIVVAGNHDFLCERDPALVRQLFAGAHYLEHEAVSVAGLAVFGSPWQPWFHDWAFNLRRGAALAAKWAEVPAGVDLLVTHTPPLGCLDRTARGEEVGCGDLAAALPRIAPRVHVFGHIHEAYGTASDAGRLSINASTCTLAYRAVQPPVVVEWSDAGARLVT